MADQYIGEIRAFPYSYAPEGWLQCQGQSVSIQQYTALYSIIANIYGIATATSFVLPNLNGATNQPGLPMLGAGQGKGLSNYTLGQKTGVQTVTLADKNMPPHNHSITGINAGAPPATYAIPTNTSHLSRLTNSAGVLDFVYSDQALPTGVTNLAATTIGISTGTGGSHDNNQPYLGFIYAIATEGLYPSPDQ